MYEVNNKFTYLTNILISRQFVYNYITIFYLLCIESLFLSSYKIIKREPNLDSLYVTKC